MQYYEYGIAEILDCTQRISWWRHIMAYLKRFVGRVIEKLRKAPRRNRAYLCALAITILLTLFAGHGDAAGGPLNWTSPLPLDGGEWNFDGFDTASTLGISSDGTWIVVWTNNVASWSSTGRKAMARGLPLAVRSTDFGKTWSPAWPTAFLDPSIMYYDRLQLTNVGTTWLTSGTGPKGIRSDSDGQIGTWSEFVPGIDWDNSDALKTAGPHDGAMNSLFTDSLGNVAILYAYYQPLPGSGGISLPTLWVTRSGDAGWTGTPPALIKADVQQMNKVGGNWLNSDMNDHDTILTAWPYNYKNYTDPATFGTFLFRSANGGITWNVATGLAGAMASTKPVGGFVGPPEITAGTGNNWFVWWWTRSASLPSGHYTYHYAISENDGLSWTVAELPTFNMDTTSTVVADYEVVSVEGTSWAVAAFAPDPSVIFTNLGGSTRNPILPWYIYSDDNGTTWSAPDWLHRNTPVTEFDAREIRLASDGSGHLLAVWEVVYDTTVVGIDTEMQYSILQTLTDEVWVDFSYIGPESGTADQPYNTLVEGSLSLALATGTEGATSLGQNLSGTLHIMAGNTAETLVFANPMTLLAEGGAVRIGVAGGE